MIDLDHPVVKRCIDGTRAEFEGRRADAHALYQQAWDAAQDDYAACIAAHYLARFQATPDAIFAWKLCIRDSLSDLPPAPATVMQPDAAHHALHQAALAKQETLYRQLVK